MAVLFLEQIGLGGGSHISRDGQVVLKLTYITFLLSCNTFAKSQLGVDFSFLEQAFAIIYLWKNLIPSVRYVFTLWLNGVTFLKWVTSAKCLDHDK